MAQVVLCIKYNNMTNLHLLSPQELDDLAPETAVSISEKKFDEHFKPKGAIAFFVLLVLLGAAIWYGIYFLMIERN